MCVSGSVCVGVGVSVCVGVCVCVYDKTYMDTLCCMYHPTN